MISHWQELMKDEQVTNRCLRRKWSWCSLPREGLGAAEECPGATGLVVHCFCFVFEEHFNCATYLWHHAHAQCRDLIDKVPTRLALEAGLSIWSQGMGSCFYITGEKLFSANLQRDQECSFIKQIIDLGIVSLPSVLFSISDGEWISTSQEANAF